MRVVVGDVDSDGRCGGIGSDGEDGNDCYTDPDRYKHIWNTI